MNKQALGRKRAIKGRGKTSAAEGTSEVSTDTAGSTATTTTAAETAAATATTPVKAATDDLAPEVPVEQQDSVPSIRVEDTSATDDSSINGSNRLQVDTSSASISSSSSGSSTPSKKSPNRVSRLLRMFSGSSLKNSDDGTSVSNNNPPRSAPPTASEHPSSTPTAAIPPSGSISENVSQSVADSELSSSLQRSRTVSAPPSVDQAAVPVRRETLPTVESIESTASEVDSLDPIEERDGSGSDSDGDNEGSSTIVDLIAYRRIVESERQLASQLATANAHIASLMNERYKLIEEREQHSQDMAELSTKLTKEAGKRAEIEIAALKRETEIADFTTALQDEAQRLVADERRIHHNEKTRLERKFKELESIANIEKELSQAMKDKLIVIEREKAQEIDRVTSRATNLEHQVAILTQQIQQLTNTQSQERPSSPNGAVLGLLTPAASSAATVAGQSCSTCGQLLSGNRNSQLAVRDSFFSDGSASGIHSTESSNADLTATATQPQQLQPQQQQQIHHGIIVHHLPVAPSSPPSVPLTQSNHPSMPCLTSHIVFPLYGGVVAHGSGCDILFVEFCQYLAAPNEKSARASAFIQRTIEEDVAPTLRFEGPSTSGSKGMMHWRLLQRVKDHVVNGTLVIETVLVPNNELPLSPVLRHSQSIIRSSVESSSVVSSPRSSQIPPAAAAGLPSPPHIASRHHTAQLSDGGGGGSVGSVGIGGGNSNSNATFAQTAQSVASSWSGMISMARSSDFWSFGGKQQQQQHSQQHSQHQQHMNIDGHLNSQPRVSSSSDAGTSRFITLRPRNSTQVPPHLPPPAASSGSSGNATPLAPSPTSATTPVSSQPHQPINPHANLVCGLCFSPLHLTPAYPIYHRIRFHDPEAAANSTTSQESKVACSRCRERLLRVCEYFSFLNMARAGIVAERTKSKSLPVSNISPLSSSSSVAYQYSVESARELYMEGVMVGRIRMAMARWGADPDTSTSEVLV
ncbi:hypothetical protein GQ42DRAFT_74482 [Ramicandelaber brevisporus]|nr:hypothetical protein GQ42DRAFT_74482 [Ramicandelaber brevisporus]